MLIDGHSMAFRAFFALPVDNFSTTGGQTTNAVYGFLSMLSNILSEEKPTHVAVAFDVARETFRNEIFPEYKAQREKTPEEFRGQVPLIQQVLKEMGIVTLEKDNYEADDIIATLATQAKPEGFETLIVTGDRDSFQLVNDTTTVLYPMRGVTTLHRFTPAAIEKKYGLTPTQYPDFAALRGDPSDNLPGIPGVGEKTATKWIVQYGTLENLIDHADEIRGKVGDNFRERVANVQLNRDITEMVKDLPLPYGPNELELRPADAQGIIDFFDRLEFGDNLRERVFRTLSIEGAGVTASTSDSATKLEAVSLDDGALAVWLDELHEPAALQVGEHTLMIGSADEKGKTSSQAVSLDLGELSAEDADTLREWLAGDHPKLVHDCKSAMHALWNYGFELAGVIHDTFLAAYLLRPSQRSYSLDNVVQRHLGQTLSQADGQMTLLDGPAEDASHVAAVIDLAERLAVELDEAGLYSVYADLEVPLAPVLGRMERVGIAVDVDALEELHKQAQAATDEAESEARNLVDKPELNLGSPKQLQEVLFDQLGMPKTKKTKTGYSTAAKEIEGLAKVNPHPFLDYLLKFRESQKMKSTVEGLIKAVADDGRIHTTFNQTVAATGRLSSSDPNLQNIPVRTEEGRRIRSLFVPGEGFSGFMSADYSQIELRILAHLSGDEKLREAFLHQEDIHRRTAAEVLHKDPKDVTAAERSHAKAVNFGIIYGISDYGLARDLGISREEAGAYIEKYLERYPKVRQYMADSIAAAKESGRAETMYGRFRVLPDIHSRNFNRRSFAERTALNTPIQGAAADIIKRAMNNVYWALVRNQLKSRMLLQVHDELVLEVVEEEREIVAQILEMHMPGAAELAVPLVVDIHYGTNWEMAK